MTQYKVVKGKRLGSVLVKQFSRTQPGWGLSPSPQYNYTPMYPIQCFVAPVTGHFTPLSVCLLYIHPKTFRLWTYSTFLAYSVKSREPWGKTSWGETSRGELTKGRNVHKSYDKSFDNCSGGRQLQQSCDCSCGVSCFLWTTATAARAISCLYLHPKISRCD